jgi:hypothetical protein
MESWNFTSSLPFLRKELSDSSWNWTSQACSGVADESSTVLICERYCSINAVLDGQKKRGGGAQFLR